MKSSVKDKAIQQIQISSKVNAAAARCLTWSTPMGLVHEYTKLFGGRVSEVHLVWLWGSLGIQYCDVQEWKDWTHCNAGTRSKKLRLKTAIDDVDIEKLIDLEDDNETSPDVETMTVPPDMTVDGEDDDHDMQNENDLAATIATEASANSDKNGNEDPKGNGANNNKPGNYIMCLDECHAQYKHRQEALEIVAKKDSAKRHLIVSPKSRPKKSPGLPLKVDPSAHLKSLWHSWNAMSDCINPSNKTGSVCALCHTICFFSRRSSMTFWHGLEVQMHQLDIQSLNHRQRLCSD